MKRYHRFYLLETPTSSKAVLDKTQSHHLVKVLRLTVGVKVELFDKSGNTYQAEIISVGKLVQLKILSQKRTTNYEQRTTIILATAIPRGPRMDWLVEKCAELGLNRLILLETRYSVVKRVGATKITRWKKIAIESVKQSRQTHLMEITEILPFRKLFDSIIEYDLKLFATPEGDEIKRLNLCNQWRKIIYLIGPEGGFSPEEISQTKSAGFKAVRLPVEEILRVETAAVA